MKCDEEEGLDLEDDAIRIFLNTRGCNSKGVSQELIDLLHYIENTSEDISKNTDSQRIKKMQERIATIKSSEEIGVKFMQEWEEKIIERRKAREEGLKEGLQAGLAEGLEKSKMQLERINQLNRRLIEEGRVDDVMKSASDTEYQKQLLREYGIES